MTKELKHINRPLTDEQRREAEVIRSGAQQDFPPKLIQRKSPPLGIPSQILATREQRGMTRYELGKIANVSSTVVRAIEQGGDVPLSQFHAVVTSLGLVIELVEQS
ncbi:MAG: helix-turn-helix transcriptional regulator [Planctomycetota bacterium]